ncbi:XdhC family protein [Pseudactinotalea sp. HY158]|uniref:XdhC family protein n=1 Tax=Pseudactinotalea sp. HY158 TaxID=2654547 RepID=UPI00129D0A29|nr:XdhC/CoxI family protein [Pseudactinotalea sp. HY158]QGH70698.1 hypothetical protein GCE65_15255 [Pseudactinotalea sp. HY158]
MRELLAEIAGWAEPFALATVVETWRSAPRLPGAALAVDAAGHVIGSVSVGCIEADVYERCRDTLATGTPQLARYGVSDDEAFAVGMTCGGEIEVFIERMVPGVSDLRWLREQVSSHRPAALVTVLEGPQAGRHVLLSGGTPVGEELPPVLLAQIGEALGRAGRDEVPRTFLLGGSGGGRSRALIEPFLPPPQLLVFGGVDFAASLATIGKVLGYHVVVCDARPVFATRERFPDADEVVVDWPHRYLGNAAVDERTAICVLTHDAKFDEPLLELAVELPAGYIGAMGSRRTHRERSARLRARGVTDAAQARIHSPIGLDLGGHTPAETAVSIMAEVVATRRGGQAGALSGRDGAIHAHRDGGAASVLLSELAVVGVACSARG